MNYIKTFESWENNELIMKIESLKSLFINAAQEVYNNWEQVDGYDDMYGHGGICDDIAGAISNVLNENGLDSTTIYDEHDFHTCAYVIDYEKQYMIQVDIHHSYYEKGSAYTWIKIPNVKFNEDMISINDMSSYYENYFDEEGNMYDI